MPASPLIATSSCVSPGDAFEGAVVVLGPVELIGAAGDDPAGAAVLRAGGDHGVLVVITALVVRKQPLEVAEHRSVLARVRERAALVDQRERRPTLGLQLLLEDPRQPAD